MTYHKKKFSLKRCCKDAIKKLIPWYVIEKLRLKRLLRKSGALEPGWGMKVLPKLSDSSFGINVFGFHSIPFGLGQGVNSTCIALERIGVKIERIDFTSDQLAYSYSNSSDFDISLPYAVNICQINPPEMGFLVSYFKSKSFSNRYNIGFWVWEQDPVPDTWIMATHYVNEIWVASEYIAQAAKAGKVRLPIKVIPHCVEVPKIEMLPSPEDMGIPLDKKMLLCMFDMSSTAERKNPLGSLQAIVRASEGRDDVRIVLKVRNPTSNPEMFDKIVNLLRGYDHVILDKSLLHSQILGLLAHSAAYVSLHRSEGFGLFIAEAMACGCPVVATGYSGNMDFMTQRNSLPVKFSMIKNQKFGPPYYKGFKWAEPDIEDAVEKIRWVLEHPSAAKALGALGREQIHSLLSPVIVGEKIRKALSY